MDQTLFDKLGGRKFVLSLVVLAIGTAVQLIAKDGVSQSFVALLLGALGVFNAANAVITARTSTEEAPATPEPPPPAIDAMALSDINSRVAALEQQVGQHQQALVTIGTAVDAVNKRLLSR